MYAVDSPLPDPIRAFRLALARWVPVFQLLLGAALATYTLSGADGKDVVIVYAKGNGESRAVAEHYARARNVPESQWIELKVTSDHSLSRDEYVAQIQEPLLGELSKRGLMSFTNFTSLADAQHTGGPAVRCTAASVRYLVLCYGMPYRINNEPRLLTTFATNFPAPVRRNDASVDSELMLLPGAGSYPLIAGLPNPFYSKSDRSQFHPTNGVFMVGRIDGPTSAIARGLVDKALYCETNGFSGNAYIDLRNITSGPYRVGDEWMTNAASVCRRVGLSTYVDNRPETLPSNFPLSQVGVYIGWYSWNVDGPFTRPEVEFMPGAIAYHLHSYNGQSPRDSTSRWVGPLLSKGATVTFGSINEPYLEFTPNPGVVMELLAAGGYTVGEAALSSQQWLSWVNLFMGDPLFTPFQTDLTRQEAAQVASRSPNIHWTVLRKANVIVSQTGNPSEVRDVLLNFPLTTNSPVLAEKVASLFADASQFKSALSWASNALALSPSPQQRLRLLLNLAEWQALSLNRDEAYDTLLEVERFREDYRDSLPFRERQLQLARDLVRTPEITRLKDEIGRLNAAAEAAKKP
jgi:uncharacterized protein (TIGR03790 family)